MIKEVRPSQICQLLRNYFTLRLEKIGIFFGRFKFVFYFCTTLREECCCSSVVEHFLGKEEVTSSSLVNSSKVRWLSDLDNHLTFYKIFPPLQVCDIIIDKHPFHLQILNHSIDCLVAWDKLVAIFTTVIVD